MVLIGANALKNLKKKEIRVLQAIEVGMKKSEYVEIDLISKFAGYTVSETERWLKTCHKMDLVHRWTGHFIGFELTIHGYDALALNALYERKIVKSIGREMGVGKESKVYYALTPEEEEIILKLHRVGYTSFQHVKKKRRYTANKKHISELYSSRLSAETEAKWLDLSNSIELSVPKLIAINRHILALELIDGVDLVKLNLVPTPLELMDDIINFIKLAWEKGNFVHGDLSEHNIILKHIDSKPVIIDFPQAVDRKSIEAHDLLERDVQNILIYFSRKHGIEADFKTVLKHITSGELND